MFKNANAMLIFAEVVKRGSFTKAAKELNISKVAVSNHIKQLEMQLDIKLLNRSTRKISLTEAGRLFSENCLNVSKEIEFAKSQISDLKLTPTGKLRIACSVNFGIRHITPAVAEFKKQHPTIEIELLVSDKKLDLVSDNIDIAFRPGPIQSSNLIARKILSSQFIVCASAQYFKNRKIPTTTGELSKEKWIIYHLSNKRNLITVRDSEKIIEFKIDGDVSTDNSMVRRKFLLEGLGLTKISQLDVKEELKNGTITKILPQLDFGTMEMFALYQNRSLIPKKQSLFLEFITKWFSS